MGNRMRNETKPRSLEKKTERKHLPAGDFSSWLRHARRALLIESETEVECGECIACCSSFQFIHCRVFSAAGIDPGDDDKIRITERVRRWRFSYRSKRDREVHAAIQAAARFIREHAECFPGKKVPGNPSQLAILAIEVYSVFLTKSGASPKTGRAASDAEIANAIVKACRKFDARMPA